MKPVTIESVLPHGIRQLLVYCRGKSEGDWPLTMKQHYRLAAFTRVLA